MADCIAKITADGKISKREAGQIIREVTALVKKLQIKGDPDPFGTAAKQLSDKLVTQAQEQSERAIRNSGIRASNLARVTAERPEDAALHSRAILVSENGANKNNIANMSAGLIQTWGGVLKSELRKAGLLDYARSEGALSDIATEMWNIRQGAKPKPNDPSYEAARLIMRSMEAVRARLNGEGGKVSEAVDYVMRTSHDPEKLRFGGRGRPGTTDYEAAFTQWWKDIRPLLNDEKTFEDVAPRENETEEQAQERFGRSAFKAIWTGKHESEDRALGSTSFGGTPSLARRISQGRTFFFKDGASWASYMKTYGRQLNALELAMDTIYSGGRAVGNLHFLGDNPEGNAKMLVDQVTKWLKDNHPDLVQKYEADLQQDITALRPGFDNLLHQVGAIPSSPITDLKHRIIDGALKIVNMDTLGNVGETHATSLPTTFYLAGKSLGMNSFEILGGLAKSMLPHSADRVAALSEQGAYFDGIRVTNPYDNGGTIPGYISSAHDLFMTMTGIRYIMRHAKAGFIEMLSNHLLNNSTRAFDELHPQLQKTLLTFGIDSNKWDLIRSVRAQQGPSGRYYLSPHAVLEAEDSKVASILGPEATPESIESYKQEAADQLMMFYSRMADLSTVTPGPRERALLHGSGKGNDISSLFTQFSAWPLAATHQLIAKTYYESQTKGKGLYYLGVAAGLSMLAGYVRMSLRNLQAGKPPEKPQNAWQAAFLGLRSMAAGGVAGILGDRLIGNIGQMVNNNTPIGGPLISNAIALGDIALKYAHALANPGTKYNMWADLVHLGTQNVPFANLAYFKGAFDYLLFYHLFEAAQPGWWARTNQARLRRGEGAYAGYFPGAPIPYNPLTPEIGPRGAH